MKNDIKGWVEFAGDLFDEIDPDESNWEISSGGLEISLQKKVSRGWSQILKENDQGEEIFNEEYVAQVHDRLKHMTTGTIALGQGPRAGDHSSKILESFGTS